MNSFFTKDPIVGTPLTPSIIRVMNTAIRRNQPIAGNGVRLTHTAGGTIIHCTVKGGGGGGTGVAELYPYKCRFAEEDSGSSSGGGYYKFYLPEGSDSATISGCLNLNGHKVSFHMVPADADEGNTFDRYSWKRTIDSGDMVLDSVSSGYQPKEGETVSRDSGGLVVCVLMRDSGEQTGFHARIMTEKALANITGSDGGFIPDDNIFPVCYIHELDIQTTTGEGDAQKTVTNTVREIKQLAVGEQMINDQDKSPFRIVMTDCGAMISHQHYRLEEVLKTGQSDFMIPDSCAASILWFAGGESGVGSFVWGSESDFNSAVSDPTRFCIPLYKFTEADGMNRFRVDTDLRFIPTCQVWMNEALES